MTAIQDIIEAARPPEERGWIGSQTSSIFADLIGSACALIQAAPLIDGFLDAYRQNSRFDFWKVDTLFEDFYEAVITEGGSRVAWGHNANLKAWSSLFFLNKAENNLAAAFDLCINAWLRLRLGMDPKAPLADDAWFLMLPSTRAIILQRFAQGAPAKLLSDIRTYYGKHWSRSARQFIRKLRKECAEMRTEETYHFLRESKKMNPVECVMVVYNRVNDFKHRVHGLMDRRGIDYAIEWAVAALAHVGMGVLWKEGMLQDTGHPWRTKNPVVISATG